MKKAEKIQKSPTIKCSLHFRPYVFKPKSYAARDIQDYMKKKYASAKLFNTTPEPLFEGSITELLDEVGNNGKSWYGALFDGNFEDDKLNADSVLYVQVFALDVDCKDEYSSLTIQDSIDKCESLGLDWAGIYKTFSYTEEQQKHRIVLYFEEPLKPIEFDLMAMMLKELFPEADKACFNINKLFYGGYKGLILPDEIKPVNMANIYNAYLEKLETLPKHTKSRRIETIAKKFGIKILNGTLDIEIQETGIIPHFTDPDSYKPSGSHYQICRENRAVVVEDDMNFQDRLYGNCQLFTDLVDGHVGFESRRILINNLKFFIGGTSFIEDCIGKNIGKYSKPFYVYKNQIKYYSKSLEYQESCRKCPYYDTCDLKRYGSIYHFLKEGTISKPEYIEPEHRKKVIKSKASELYNLTELDRWNYYPLEQLDKDLQALFPKILDQMIENLDKGVSTGAIYLKAPTGLGKTEALLKYLSDNWDKLQGYKIAVAFKTYNQIDEIAGRLLNNYGIDIPKKPDRSKIKLPEDVAYRYNNYLALGMHKKANSLFFDELGKHKDEQPEYMEYLEQLNTCYNSQIVFTTHDDVTFTSSHNHDMVVFDEEVKTQTTTGTAKVNDLLKALEGVKGYRANQMREFLASSDETKIIFMDEYYNKEYIQEIEYNILNSCIEGNALVQALSAQVYFKLDNGEIMWGIKHKLPKAICLIMSATLNEELLRATQGKDIYFKDIGMVADGGELIQFADYSFSKNDIIHNLEARVAYINEQLQQRGVNPKDVVVLSYKENVINSALAKEGYIINENLYHFNGEASDTLNGKDLVVIGTPFLDARSYEMLATLMFGYTFEEDDGKMTIYEKFDINHIRLRFPAFKKDEIRLVQQWHIESQLVQLVGRARLVRNSDTKVYLFSNYPLLESNEYWFRGEDILD